MLSEQRQFEITELICREGKASISELAEYFDVSCETIRRDLITISKGNRVRKVHGGAVAIRPHIQDDEYAVRQVQNAYNKQKIGERAALLVKDNDVIGVDSGTCAEAFARSIFNVKNVTFIVRSLPVAAILAQKISAGDFSGKVIIISGTVVPENGSIIGMKTILQLGEYHITKSFVGATAIADSGIMAGDEETALLSEMLVRQSRASYIIAESAKMYQQSFYNVCDFDEITAIITDDEHPINFSLKRKITESGAEIITVPLR